MSGQLTRLSAWLKGAGITWDDRLMRMRPSAGGLGVFAVADIKEGATLCEIPRAAVLSVRTTGIADLLELHGIREGLGLNIAIMYELSIGAISPWHGYLSELPAREFLPVFWSDPQRALLMGTEREGAPAEDAALMREDYEEHVLPLVQQYPERLRADSFTLERFMIAASWVASRAFGVDSHHGMSMVPLADIFNHKAAVVALAGNYQIEPNCFGDDSSRDSASDTASASGQEEPDDDEAGPDEHHGEDAAKRAMQLRGLPVSRGSLLDGSVAAAHRLEIGICATDRGNGEEILQIVAASDVARGCEVHNTYGELSSADLVNKYGFAPVPKSNPFDAVTLDKAALVGAARHALGERSLRQRCRLLTQESELLDEGPEPFEVLPGACIGPSLLVALHVLTAGEADLQHWRGLQDALAQLQRMCTGSPAGASEPVDAPDRREDRAASPAATVEPAAATACGRPVPTQCCNGGHAGGSHSSVREPAKKRRKLEDLDSEGKAQRRGLHEGAANGCCGDGACGSREAGQAHAPDADESDWLPGVTSISALGPSASTALSTCIQQRLARYRLPDLAQDRAQLAVAEREVAGSRKEGARGRLAALRLVVAEKELLHTALAAAEANVHGDC